MPVPVEPPIFDGHNDLMFKLFAEGSAGAASTFLNSRDGHLDAERCRSGGFGGGFFAVWIPSPIDIEAEMDKMSQPTYDLALPDPLSCSEATSIAMAQCATLLRLEALGAVKICRTADDIRACFANGQIAAILHFEGAEAIDADLNALDVFYAAGLRSLGPVWSRPTIFGHGVPFRFPSTGDTGPGLTPKGVELVRRCNDLGILVDLSHLTEAGFWDVARISRKPLVATHSNAHALCPHARNLTDPQLDAIRASDGIVGLNFAIAFLRADGRMVDTGIDTMLRHLDYLIERLGEDRVGFGSDFDGAEVPSEIGSAAGLPKLRQALIDHGFGVALMSKLCHGNWLRVLDLTWAE